MVKSNYATKLKDPRWQKKRLEILERDGWACQLCGDTESTLMVHHRQYMPGRDPWDCPSEFLITLCEECHTNESDLRAEEEKALLDIMREKFWAKDVNDLACAINEMEIYYDSEVTMSAITWLLRTPEQLYSLVSHYMKTKHSELKNTICFKE